MNPAVRQLLMGGRQICQVPSGFDWTPPVTIYRQGRRYSTDYRAEDWKPATTAQLFVATNGSDTTGDGTEALPYRSVKKAITSMAQATEILVKAGFYNRSMGWDSTSSPQFDCVVRGYGGLVTVSTAWEGTSWTITTSGTYAGTRSQVGAVIDYAVLTADGIPTRLTTVADQATCEATAGSWATNGTTVWVHRADGSAPDSNIKALMSLTNGYIAHDKKVFVQNITFEGGLLGAFTTLATALTANTRLVLDTCNLTFSNSNGLNALGVGLVILKGCTGYGNVADGFNYHVGGNLVDINAVEIDCESYANGDIADTDYNDNASTSHDNCRVVRVQTTGRKAVGPIFADVNTAMSWNLGCTATSSLAVGAQNTGFQAGDTATQYLDGCTSTGCDTQASKGASATQYQRNCNLGSLPSY